MHIYYNSNNNTILGKHIPYNHICFLGTHNLLNGSFLLYQDSHCKRCRSTRPQEQADSKALTKRRHNADVIRFTANHVTELFRETHLLLITEAFRFSPIFANVNSARTKLSSRDINIGLYDFNFVEFRRACNKRSYCIGYSGIRS